jgi:hypothetical protein
MRRLFGLVATILTVLALSATPVLAVVPGTLDQQQTVTSNEVSGNTYLLMAQTFTAGVTGSLTAVSVYVGAVAAPGGEPAVVTPPPGSNLSLAVFSTSSGLPDTSGTPMYQGYATVGTTAGWFNFVLSSPAAITSGKQYAIVVDSLSLGFANWTGDCTNDYAGGQALVKDTDASTPQWLAVPTYNSDYCMLDFAFRTYVTTSPTPPPTSTSEAPISGGGASPVPLLLFSLLASAAAFLTARRTNLLRR